MGLMTNRAQRGRRRDAPTADLHEVLTRLLDEIVDATPFERVVVVAGWDGDLVGVGRGVSQPEVDAFTRELSRWHDAGGGETAPGVEASPLAVLASLASPVLVPAPSPSERFSAVVAVEGGPEHPALARISEILRRAAPDVTDVAEAHALAARIATISGSTASGTAAPGTESASGSTMSERPEVATRYAQSALDAHPDPVLVIDAEARILFSNRRAAELFVSDPASDEDRRRAVAANRGFLRVFQTTAHGPTLEPSPTVREILLLDPQDGSSLSFEVFSSVLDEPSSGPPARLVVLRDSSDREASARELELQFSRSVAAEHRARVESERLDVLVQNAAVPIFVTDGDARIRLVNREAARLLEPRPGTAPSSPRLRDLEANHRKLTGFVGELLLHARARHGGRLLLVDPDEARELPVLAVSTKILDERGEPNAVVTVLLDLTHEAENRQLTWTTGELTRRNTQLEEQRTVLERAARLKNEFLATMSHELRTPINAVLGYNALLRDGLFGQLSERQRDALDRMRNAAEHLLSLINDVLDLSRVEAGRVGLSPVAIEWPPFLEALSEAVRPLAARKELAYSVEVEAGLPTIRTDETRLRQVLFALLTNAVKFTDRGSLELRVRSVPGGNRVRIDVTDTGIGIDESDLDTIFEEFTQVDQSSTRQHGGAGLGLAISRRLIRAMGGALTVKSAPGRGSTFRVELPLVPPTHRELASGAQAGRARIANG